ncbi:MAG: phosphoglycolate phosphatase [Candidatus Competibacteraceae bacterium]|jgi:phosphoglycolate phosphatase|nr:phosphoglycolate phosphatase [Candidatus Competibacteraceae bacterium]
MFKNIEAIFFDLDGTLVDSVPDLAVAVDSMMGQLGLPPRGEHKVRQWVGNGAENLIRRALADDFAGNVAADQVAAARPLFEAAYQDNLCLHSRLYPGVLDGLNALQDNGLSLACITNKPARFAEPLVDKLGIGHFFKAVLGGECAPNRKPAPDALFMTAQRLNVAIERVLMVGDSKNDVGAARNAGCPVVAVPYGYNHGEDIRSAQPDVVIESLTELAKLIGTVN